jgi:hypothetical protein
MYVHDPRFKLLVTPQGSGDIERKTCGKFGMVFIDADHSFPWVWHDTMLARTVTPAGGIILWHDYWPASDPNPRRSVCATRQVVEFINGIEPDPIARLQGTCLCFEFRQRRDSWRSLAGMSISAGSAR